MFARRSTHSTLVLGILAALVLFGVSHQVSFARLVACRSDPVVVLSDGTVVDLSADIDTLLWNVTEVHYTLHVPQGLSPVVVLHTPTWLTSQETFTIYSDNAPDIYSSSTTVQTRGGSTDVTAHLLVNLATGDASGTTGQKLKIELRDK